MTREPHHNRLLPSIRACRSLSMTQGSAPFLERVRLASDEAVAAPRQATSPEALEEWRTTYLGRRGSVSLLLREVSALPTEERPAAGAEGNKARQALEAAF